MSVYPTTSQARLSISIGCTCRSESSTGSPFWSTKSCTDSRHNISVHSTTSLIYLAADRFVLLAPTVCQCLRSNEQPSPTRALPVLAHRPRTTCQTTRHLPSCPSFANVSKLITSYNLFFDYFSTNFFSRGPSSSLHYLGHFVISD